MRIGSTVLFFWLGLMLSSQDSSNYVVHADHKDDHVTEETISFEWNSVKLPYKVSDITATYMQGEKGDSDGFIIITGGCDDPLGNQRNKTEAELGVNLDLFYCYSVTGKTLKFDPFANTFTSMNTAPEQRYRHAATVYNGELWVFGGRDSLDNFVTEISSFNPLTDKWTSRGKLPDDVVTSDLTAWTYNDNIFIAGGFDKDYVASPITYRLDVSKDPKDFLSMTYSLMENMKVPRGDMHAVVVDNKAYLAGGITHENDYCVGMAETEVYDMDMNTWERLADLNYGRADMAVSVLNSKIFAAGGESKPSGCADLADPAAGSIPEKHVEILDPKDGTTADWHVIGEIDEERFRFAAATVPALNRMYHFGGQLPFDFECQCFPTDDAVGIVMEGDATKGTSAGATPGIAIAILAPLYLIIATFHN